MKEATGELSTTVIAVVAIAAIAMIFTTFLLPGLKQNIISKTKCAEAVRCDTCKKNHMTCYYDETDAKGKLKEQKVTCPCDN